MSFAERYFSVKYLKPKTGAKGEIPKSGEMYSNLAKIALPSVCEMVFISLMGSIDTMMVGGLGTQAIASVGLVSQPRMLMLCMFFALNIGITAVVARRKGQNRREDANRALRTALSIVLGLSAVMTFVAMTFARPLMKLAGAQQDTIDDAVTYFKIVTSVLPFNCLSMAMCAGQRGVGNTRITMYVNVTSNAVNVVLNYFLINGIWIFPRWGVKGAAVATAIGLCVGGVLAFVSLFRQREKRGFLYISFTEGGFIDAESALAVSKIGINAMIEQIALRFGFFMYARIVANLGTTPYAAHTVAMQFLNLSFTFADGIGVASTSLVGQMLGRERPDLSHIYGKIAQRIALIGGILLASTIALFRFRLAGLFTDDGKVLDLTAKVLLIVAMFQPLQMLSVITSGALRGAGDTKFVARMMLVCVAVLRPALAFLAVKLITRFLDAELALLGAWAASLVDMAVRMVLSMRRFNSGVWHSIKV